MLVVRKVLPEVHVPFLFLLDWRLSHSFALISWRYPSFDVPLSYTLPPHLKMHWVLLFFANNFFFVPSMIAHVVVQYDI